MRKRDVVVGMCVSAPAVVGQGKRVIGGVTHVTGTNSTNWLVTIATDTGVVHQPPEDCEPSEEPSWLVQTRDLRPGQVVVLFNGKRRTVKAVRPSGFPGSLRVDYAVEEDLTFRGNSAAPDGWWRLLSTAEENR